MDGRNKKFILELQKKPKLRRESGLYVIDGPKMAGETDPDDVDEIYITKAFLSSQGFLECEELIRQKKYTIITDSEMKQISDTVSPQGILIIARQRKYKGLCHLQLNPENMLSISIAAEKTNPRFLLFWKDCRIREISERL